MKPVKIKLLKRTWNGQDCEEYELSSSFKKGSKGKAEKENRVVVSVKKGKSDSRKPKKSGKVLAESPLPSRRANVKKRAKSSSSSSSSSSSWSSEEEDDDDDTSDTDSLEEMFFQLKKNGIKTLQPHISNGKSLPISPKSRSKSQEKKSVHEENGVALDKATKIMKKLIEDFENIPKSKGRTSRARNSVKNEDEKICEVNNKKMDETIQVNESKESKGKRNSKVTGEFETPKKMTTKPEPLSTSKGRNTRSRRTSKLETDIEVIDLEEGPENSEPMASVKKTRKRKISSSSSSSDGSKQNYKPPQKKVMESQELSLNDTQFIGSRRTRNRRTSKLESDFELVNLENVPDDKSVTSSAKKSRKRKVSSSSVESYTQELENIPEDFELKSESKPSSRRKSSRLTATHVPELEKLPEDLILNFKRTPKQSRVYEWECTPQKTKSSETPKRNTLRNRRITLGVPEELIDNLEMTPKRRSTRATPRKSSSTKKRQSSVMKTPNCKTEERLPRTPLEKARLSLHVAAVPDGLPCREKEFNNIYNFVKNKLLDGIGGCMYISGVPGTGKTATVTQVIKSLRIDAKNSEVPEFKYIEMNGMRLSDPRQAYVQLWQKLFDREERITAERAQKDLDSWFSKMDKKNERKTTVLLVDELDLICTKKQDVVYNLLDWPTRTHSRLVVLTIANTMDMPERLFKGRITSRMGLTRLTFLPYTFKQLEEIVLERLKGLDAFVPDAVQLVTRKVAAVSGDARRALDICRRAAELPAPDETVKISHIELAIKEMTNSNIVKIIRNCSHMEKLFLRALCDVTCRSNVEEIELIKVMDQLMSICVLEGVPRPPVTTFLTICHRLKCSRLIFSNQTYPGILQRVMLNVTQDDIHYALQT